MQIEGFRRLRGPNVYLSRPVLVTRVRLGELTGRETTDIPGFANRLLAALPGLAEHHCAAGRPGGLLTRLYGGTYFGHVAEHVALELSAGIGRVVAFGRTVLAGEPGEYDLITECPCDEPADSTVGPRLVELAVQGVASLVAGGPPHWPAALPELRERYEKDRPGPSTAAIADAARRRGIPVERVGALSLLRLGYGRRRRLVWAALTDGTSAIGCDIVDDKQLARDLLSGAGIPVPPGRVAGCADDAVAVLGELGAPVVVKPRHGCQGQHVFLGLHTPAEVREAYRLATADGSPVVVERQLTGRDYRVLTVLGRVVAAAERHPAHVVGDGSATVAQLVARANADPRRGTGHDRALTRLALDEPALRLLARQGLRAGAVPGAGQVVWLRQSANLSTGGTSDDVTGRVHPDVAELARRTAAAVGVDVAGIDLRLPDIAEPLPPTEPFTPPAAGVIEVNAAPGLRMHLSPSVGAGRDVATAIVDALYPDGAPSRIPTVAVTGTNGKSTVARLIAHLIAGDGRRVGLTTTDGVWVAGRLVHRADATGPGSAQLVLADPTVDAAVLETARGGMVRRGLGYDWTDVGVITNIDADHLGQDGVADLADLIDVKSLVAERVAEGGTLVLNADCPRTRSVAELSGVRAPARNLAWFGLRPAGAPPGRTYLLVDGWLVEVADGGRNPLIPAAEVPGSFGGAAPHAVANALAALAAAHGLGVPAEEAVRRLAGFDPWTHNPGRGMRWRLGGVDVLLDYGHNEAGIAAMARTVAAVWGPGRGVAVATLPGDRRDDLLAASAGALADGFDRVVFYEDVDDRGRAPGEMRALLRAAAVRRRPAIRCVPAPDLAAAVRAGFGLVRPGEVLLLLYEKLEPVTALLEALGATPVDRQVPAAGAVIAAG